jgi:hypothetical protein
MTSRLYRTTRPLAAQVTLIVRRLGVEEVGTRIKHNGPGSA